MIGNPTQDGRDDKKGMEMEKLIIGGVAEAPLCHTSERYRDEENLHCGYTAD